MPDREEDDDDQFLSPKKLVIYLLTGVLSIGLFVAGEMVAAAAVVVVGLVISGAI